MHKYRIKIDLSKMPKTDLVRWDRRKPEGVRAIARRGNHQTWIMLAAHMTGALKKAQALLRGFKANVDEIELY